MFSRLSFLRTTIVVVAAVALVSACSGDSGTTEPPAPPPPPPPPPVVASITLSSTGLSLVPGEPQTLTAVAKDAGGTVISSPTITWSTGSSSVATVGSDGRVTGAGVGNTNITATSGTASASVPVAVADGGYVTASGGSFTSLGGKAQFEFPSGAVTTATAFRVSAVASPAADARLLAGTAIMIEPAMTFVNPVRVRLSYSTPLAADVVEPQLRVARLSGSAWLESSVFVVDRTNHLVNGFVTASGTLAVFVPPASLRMYAQLRGMDFGTEVNPVTMMTDTMYARILAADYNQVTPGNSMKFGPIHPQPNQYAFAEADTLVGFAAQNGMKVHGHVLLWHNQQPAWITASTQTRTTLLAALKEHIETVVGRYAGKIASWDVANETIADDGTGLRKSFWITVVGPDVIDSAFVWARRRDPAAKLYLNEYNAEPINRKADSLYALATRLKAAGIPIDGIGFQAHYQLGVNAPSQAQMAANIARFTAAGFDVRFTELDVRMADGTDQLSGQAGSYYATARACFTAPRCRAFTTWGFTDKYSWIPNTFPGYGRALPRDANFAPKPAYNSLRDALQQP